MKSDAVQQQFDGCTTADKVKESIEFLRANEPEDGYWLGFSGGKDSIVTYNLAKMAGVKFSAYYSCTTIDPPVMTKFIRKNYPDVNFIVPKKSFWDLILEHSIPPTRMMRWCCVELKEQKKGMIVVGIRSEESYRRAHRPRIDVISKKHILFKPIFNWKEYNVWEFIEGEKLAYPSLYDEGADRIGCVVCPMTFGRRKPIEHKMELYPHMWAKFKSTMEKWFSLYREGDFELWWNNYVFGDWVDVSKIKRKTKAEVKNAIH